MSDDLLALLRQVHSDPARLCSVLNTHSWALERPAPEVAQQLVTLVPRMASVLAGEMDDSHWRCHAIICHILGYLGPRAEEAIPALFEHAERYPRFELNVWAIGKIGGSGVVRRLMNWTYWQGPRHDRKRTDAACAAIGSLGERAIQELLEIAHSPAADEHERTIAILNLQDNTSCPVESVVSVMAEQMERSEFTQCLETLMDRLAGVGQNHPELVIRTIAPRLLGRSDKATEFIRILSQLGPPAVATLQQALDANIEPSETMRALAQIGEPGLERLYELLATSTHRRLILTAIDALPAAGHQSFRALTDVIQRHAEPDQTDSSVVLAGLWRLSRFSDQQETVRDFLNQFRCHPDDSIARSVMPIIDRITESKADVRPPDQIPDDR